MLRALSKLAPKTKGLIVKIKRMTLTLIKRIWCTPRILSKEMEESVKPNVTRVRL